MLKVRLPTAGDRDEESPAVVRRAGAFAAALPLLCRHSLPSPHTPAPCHTQNRSRGQAQPRAAGQAGGGGPVQPLWGHLHAAAGAGRGARDAAQQPGVHHRRILRGARARRQEVRARRMHALSERPTSHATAAVAASLTDSCVAFDQQTHPTDQSQTHRNMSAPDARKLCAELVVVQVPVAHGKADLTIYRDAGAQVGRWWLLLGCCRWWGWVGAEALSLRSALAFLSQPLYDHDARLGACRCWRSCRLSPSRSAPRSMR
jgi:hypothetical protein